ncbi:cupredoxin domain-containing protein [Massilia sp. S19_KUP03_FR1]|uniref:cupredoxin domain-containing protein n=1 Tax=Massilia sp. S19_KUP03_FR1 TaxID=3025503 RepID=UPI002FCD7207
MLFLWACLSPLRDTTREKLLELGTGVVPSVLRLTLGVQDVLVLHNGSPAAQVFGPLRVLPGRAVRLPFEQAGEFGFACSNHPAGQLIVQVVVPPDPGFDRLRWRFAGLVDALRYLPTIAPLSS